MIPTSPGDLLPPHLGVPSSLGGVSKAGGGGGGVDRQREVDGTGLKQREKMMDDLKKENFGLKLKIYYLEQQLERDSPEGVGELVKENLNLKAANSTLEAELRTLRTQITQLRHDLDSRTAHLTHLESLCAKYASEHSSSLADRQHADNLAEQLRRDHERIAGEAERIARALKERDGECDLLKLEIAEMRRRCAELEEASGKPPGIGRIEDAPEFQGMVKARLDALARAESAERAVQETQRRLANEIAELRSQAERAKQESLAARTEVLEAREEARRARGVAEAAKEAERSARGEAERERERAREADRARGDAEARADWGRGEVGGRDDQIAKLQATTAALTSSLHTSASRAASLEEDLRRIQEERERLKREVEEAQQRARQAEGDRDRATAVIGGEKEARERAERERDVEKKAREVVEQSLKTLQQTHTTTLSTVTTMQTQLSQLTNDLATTTSQFQHAQSQLSRHASMVDRSQHERLAAHEAELNALRVEIDRKEVRVVETGRELERLRMELEDGLREKEELVGELNVARRRLQEKAAENSYEREMKEQLTELKSKLDNQNSAARRLEAENRDLRSKLESARRDDAVAQAQSSQEPHSRSTEPPRATRKQVVESGSVIGSLEEIGARNVEEDEFAGQEEDMGVTGKPKARRVEPLLREKNLEDYLDSIQGSVSNLESSQKYRAEEAQQLKKEIDGSRAATQSALRSIQEHYGADVRGLIAELREAVKGSRNEVIELSKKLDKSHGMWHESEVRRREAEDERDTAKEKCDRLLAEWTAKCARLSGKLEAVEEQLRTKESENQALRNKLGSMSARGSLQGGGSLRGSSSGRNLAASVDSVGTRGLDFDDDIPDGIPDGESHFSRKSGGSKQVSKDKYDKDLAELTGANAKLLGRLEAAEKVLKGKEVENQALAKEIRDLKDERRKVEGSVKTAQDQIASYKSQLAKSDVSLRQMTLEATKLQEELRRLHTQILESEAKWKAEKKDIEEREWLLREELKDELQKAGKDREADNSRIMDELQKEVDKWRSKVRTLEERLATTERQFSSISEQLEATRSAKSVAEEHIRTVNAQLEDTHSSRSKEVVGLREELSAAKKQVESLREERRRMEYERGERDRTMRDMEEALKRRAEEKKKWEERWSESEAVRAKVERELGEKEVLMRKLDQEVIALENSIAEQKENALVVDEFRTRVSERDSLLLQLYHKLDAILAIGRKHDDKKITSSATPIGPADNLPLFRERLLTRLKSVEVAVASFQDKIEGVLRLCRDRLHSFEARLDSKWNTLERYEALVRKATDAQRRLQDQLSTKKFELEQSKASLQVTEEKVLSLQQQLDTSAKLASSSGSQVKILEARLRETETRLRAERDSPKIADMQERLRGSEERCTQLEKAVMDAEDRLRIERQSARDRVDELVSTVRKHERTIELLNNRARDDKERFLQMKKLHEEEMQRLRAAEGAEELLREASRKMTDMERQLEDGRKRVKALDKDAYERVKAKQQRREQQVARALQRLDAVKNSSREFLVVSEAAEAAQRIFAEDLGSDSDSELRNSRPRGEKKGGKAADSLRK
ncbi:hypothetical protein HDU93_008942 [Gonapodya sp. JEL0774]|nr:hypothetical protein HDU93_008942 [Gonapodya sp. JEL0774]